MPDLIEPKPKHAGGRPRIQIDLDKVELLARTFATDQEIADFLGISRDTVKRGKRLKAYQRAIEKGRNFTKVKLRERLITDALSGSQSALLHLSKALLGNVEAAPTQKVEMRSEVDLKAPPTLNDFFKTVTAIPLTPQPEAAAEEAVPQTH
jgi:hypothetical protein